MCRFNCLCKELAAISSSLVWVSAAGRVDVDSSDCWSDDRFDKPNRVGTTVESNGKKKN